MKKYYCPKCNKDLTKKTKKMEVLSGYFRACTNCDEDFYKFELKINSDLCNEDFCNELKAVGGKCLEHYQLLNI